MKELDFNLENAVKVLKAMKHGLVSECDRDILLAKLTGKTPNRLLGGMAKAASLFVDILTKETDFRDAIDFLSKQGVTID